ncbi:hypothetical protein GSI_07088 [Ganoderma sinense ZZ0214-1]|uniref:Uncharacterized protein n=1 Tax=Ganoderma sinense ZZ0214-1 TaxID=1077348 RepID=A0A2G8SAY0_9APHY|nr:hypothetical protein GSI_07088 [Ganoderma sinense ZZ0214-1]
MPPAAVPQQQGMTVWQKCVGLTMGFLFGGLSILRGGAGPRGVLPTLSQYMLGSAATFSFFLAIGSVIRNDGELPPHLEAARLQLSSPMMRTRSDGFANMRLRWELEKARRSDPQ